MDASRLFQCRLAPEERGAQPSLVRLARAYRPCSFLSAAQASLLARAEAAPFSKLTGGQSSPAALLELLAAELALRSAFLKTLWAALWEFVFLLGKYSQPEERTEQFRGFGRLAASVTQTRMRRLAVRGDADLTAELLGFEPREFKLRLAEAAVAEKYLKGLHVVDMHIKELCDKGQLPLLFVERFELGFAQDRTPTRTRLPRRMFTSASLRPLKAVSKPQPRKRSWESGRGPSALEEDCPSSFSRPPPSPDRAAGLPGAEPLPLSVSLLPPGEICEAEQLLSVFNPLSNTVVHVQMPVTEAPPGLPRAKTICVAAEVGKASFVEPPRALTSVFDAHPTVPVRPFYRICVIVHGLEGFGQDMRYFRSVLRHICPGHAFYISEANEQCTHESLETMGFRLATEVKFFLKSLPPESNFSLSFIGHSLGGLIIRAALPSMKELRPHFKSYFSICTPHLGCVSGNMLVNAGLLFLGKLERNKSIRQMTIEDRERYLYQLSARGDLDQFETLVFLSVYKDGYVNFDSAKVLARFDNGKKLGDIMAQNLLGNLRHVKTVVKVGVFVPGLDVGLDKFIGRNAHIETLRNPLLQNLIWRQLKDLI